MASCARFQGIRAVSRLRDVMLLDDRGQLVAQLVLHALQQRRASSRARLFVGLLLADRSGP
jgi:hypothetical protein